MIFHPIKTILIVCYAAIASLDSHSVLAADPLPEKITIATWNLEWFYDNYKGDNRSDLAKKLSAPDRKSWDWRLETMADVIAELNPTIMAFQEVENQQVVHYLRQKIKEKHKIQYRIAFIQGYDFGTEQDVAILYQDGLVEYSRREQSKEMFDSGKYHNVSKHLFAKFEWGQGDKKQSLYVCTVHFRARAEREDMRKKQARLIHKWIEDKLIAGENVIVLGDINTEHEVGKNDKDTDMGILRGLETETVDDDLTDLHQFLPEAQHATHMIGKQFDRILVSKAIIDDSEGMDMVYSRSVNRRDLVVRGEKQDEDHRDIYYQIDEAERDLSDHYPVMAEILFK